MRGEEDEERERKGREARDGTKRTKRQYVTKMAPLHRKGKLGDRKQSSGTGEV